MAAQLGLNVTGAAFTSRGITDNATATALTIASGGAVSIASPAGGYTLTLNGNASGLNIATSAAVSAGLSLSANNATAGTTSFDLLQGSAGDGYVYVRANATLNLGTNNATRFTVSAAGGLFSSGATGGDQGAGTLNVAGGLYINAAPVYSGAPQNIQNAPYTFVLSDNGKHVFHNEATARIWTIPANGTTAFPIGTLITVVNYSASGAITLNITTDTLTWSPSGATGSRTLAANGIATLIKIGATNWMISGSGLT